MAQLPYFERVKIQIEILLPLYRRLREEIGEDRAAVLLKEAVVEYGREMGKVAASTTTGSSLDKLRVLMPTLTANALEFDQLVDDEKEFSMNVRGCKYAEFFRAIGEPEFGSMITCDVDPPLTEGLGEDLQMERTQTIMKGGSHCDFRWTVKD